MEQTQYQQVYAYHVVQPGYYAGQQPGGYNPNAGQQYPEQRQFPGQYPEQQYPGQQNEQQQNPYPYNNPNQNPYGGSDERG